MREERTILVGAGEPRHMAELGRLAETLGMEVAAVVEQGRRDGTGYLGRGKREELAELVQDLEARFVVADDELTASQARVLERASGASVVDRTELIIRIFEAHARDAASRLEVELADLEYRLPRVKGKNPELSRLGGGVGGARRGPGEQQLEYDRRVIRGRIETINRRLREEKAGRQVRGSRLKEGGPPTVALVGYTNAGKTTILNALSGAGRSTKDRLFETLETTTRLVEGSGKNGRDGARPDFVVTDTVGFIRKLPTQLVHSFASTLEAARDADVVILCADASSEELEDEVSTVRRTLVGGSVGASNGAARDTEEEVASGTAPVLCLNKMDLVSEKRARKLAREFPDAVKISALIGCEPLLEEVYRRIADQRERMQVLIPHSEYAAASRLYGLAEIHAQRNTTTGLWLDVSLPRSASAKYRPYKVA